MRPSKQLQQANAALANELATLKLKVSKLQSELSEFRKQQPDVKVELVETGEMVYLEIENSGATAEFHAMLKATGVAAWPNKEAFGRWDAVPDTKRDIAHQTKARLRLAKLETEGHLMRWIVYLVTFKPYELSSNFATIGGSQPESTGWLVTLDVEIIAKPDLKSGPITRTVTLLGTGEVLVA